jgi:uncharacterized protein with von Willebrand factor type A (vWA) domain
MVVGFSRVLRGAGLDVTTGSTVLFAQALAALGADRPEAVYWAGRATLVHRPEEVAEYDRAFAAFWLGERSAVGGTVDAARVVTLALDAPGDGDAPVRAHDENDDGAPDTPVLAVRWSPAEVLRHRDFAAYTKAEFQEARRLMADVRLAGALRRSRRLRPTSRRRPGAPPDLRRTVRRSLRSGGEMISRSFLALLRFLHAAVVGRGRVEAFALGTRLTRITRELSSRDPDAALAAAGRRVVDWSGGTRLGDGLREFNDRWGQRGMARGAIVVLLSDGWDRGEPDQLSAQMARLSRLAYRVVWVNPLKASPGFAPLARGMAAALPHVDEFVEGHSLASLEQLAEVIAR